MKHFYKDQRTYKHILYIKDFLISIYYMCFLLTAGDMIKVKEEESLKITLVILLWSVLWIIYMHWQCWPFFCDMGSVIQKEFIFQTLKYWRIMQKWWRGAVDTKTTHTFVIYSWKWMGFSFAYVLLRCANGKQQWRFDKLANLKYFPKTCVYHLIVLD